jgi:SAM-dependent methyltransferase
MPDYYQNHPRAYHEKTFSIDPTSFLEPLKKHLAPACRILDIGCGSGRDMRWLQKHGFSVIGFERSPGLVRLARQNTGCPVLQGDFEDFDFSEFPSDAVLCVGSLVHVRHEKLPDVLSRILAGLRQGGKALITLKQGHGTHIDEHGRVFFYWQDSHIRSVFTEQGLAVLDFGKQVSKTTGADMWLRYVLMKRM